MTNMLSLYLMKISESKFNVTILNCLLQDLYMNQMELKNTLSRNIQSASPCSKTSPLLNAISPATSHGKGPMDGLGGTMKRRIKEATLSRKIDWHSVEEFFRCAQEFCPNATLLYISDNNIKGEITRFNDIRSRKGKEIFPIPKLRNPTVSVK